MQVGTRGERELARRNQRLRDMVSAGRRGENPLDHVPPGAEKRVLHPIQGKAQYGVEYKWSEAGATHRIRAHGPDPSAPPGTNHGGEVYRVQQGKRYMDPDGTLHKANIDKPGSPHYDEVALNDTHTHSVAGTASSSEELGMQVEDLVEYVVAGVASSDPKRRAEAADSVTDGLGAFSDRDADQLARTLVSAAVAESDEAAQQEYLTDLRAYVEGEDV